MFCTKCGTAVPDGMAFCTSCGSPMQANQAPPPPVYQAPPPPPPPVYQPPPAPQQNWQPPQQAVAQPPAPQAWAPPPQQAAVAAKLPYADFGPRLLAYLIDALIIGAAFIVYFGIVLAVILMIGGGAVFSGTQTLQDFGAALTGFAIIMLVLLVVLYIALIVGVWLYFAKSESSEKQATIGKRKMGIYVTDLNGQRLTFGRATGRFFSKIITNMIPFAIGWIMAAFTEKKQALHDMIAGTLVWKRQ